MKLNKEFQRFLFEKETYFNVIVDVSDASLELNTAQIMKFSIKDLVTFTEEILNGKLHFLCSENELEQSFLYFLLI